MMLGFQSCEHSEVWVGPPVITGWNDGWSGLLGRQIGAEKETGSGNL